MVIVNQKKKTAERLYSQPSILLNGLVLTYKYFEVDEKGIANIIIIASTTNKSSFGIINIDRNVCSGKCSCLKVLQCPGLPHSQFLR